jgi:acetylornithine deacetylase/succinyl-diaminopimelate desuccinylase-like protein
MMTRRSSRITLLLSGAFFWLAMGHNAAAQPPIDWGSVQTEATAILQRYVQIDTSNPPGETVRAADFLTEILRSEGFDVVRYESAPGKVIVYTRLRGQGAKKTILLLHHMDVVPVDRTNWQRDPFGGEVVDGFLWGRGSVDMKGIGVSHLLAILLLKRQQIPMDRDVIFMAVPDEEIGGALGTRWMIKNHFAELDPEYVLDEGGFGSRDQFSNGKLVYGIAVAEKKALWIKVRAEGISGHGSQPHSQNPNDKLVRALERMLSVPSTIGETQVVREFEKKVGSLADNKFTNAIRRSTVSLTTLRSGVGDPPKVNVIPSFAEATLDCRILPGISKQEWMLDLQRRLADPELKLEVIYESDDPMVTDWNTPLYRALEAAILHQHKDAIVAPLMLPYGTDSNAFRKSGVKSYGINPLVLPADIIATMHADNERLPVGELGKAVQVFYEAIRAMNSQ